MWNDPKVILVSYRLFSGGKIDFGYGSKGQGMSVGTAPLMAKIEVSEDAGGLEYPKGWFPLSKEMGGHKISQMFRADKDNFLPDTILLEAYRHYFRTHRKP